MPPGWKRQPRWNATTERVPSINRSCAFLTKFTSSPRLEPDVLECLSRGAEEVCCKPVVAAPGGEIAAGNPRGCAMAGRAELVEAGLGRVARRLRLVDPVLLEERATEHELRAADFVDVVLVAGCLEELERVPRLLLGLLDAAGAEVDLRERRDCLRRIGVAAGLERDAERFLQLPDRLLRVAELEVEGAEVIRQLPDVHLVGELLVGGACALGVVACEYPVALAVGDERRLEVGGADRAGIVRVLRELERALDVLAGCFVVELAAPAA